jgi:hypothetical protein
VPAYSSDPLILWLSAQLWLAAVLYPSSSHSLLGGGWHQRPPWWSSSPANAAAPSLFQESRHLPPLSSLILAGSVQGTSRHKRMVNLILMKKCKEMDKPLMQLEHLLKIQLKMEEALKFELADDMLL